MIHIRSTRRTSPDIHMQQSRLLLTRGETAWGYNYCRPHMDCPPANGPHGSKAQTEQLAAKAPDPAACIPVINMAILTASQYGLEVINSRPQAQNATMQCMVATRRCLKSIALYHDMVMPTLTIQLELAYRRKETDANRSTNTRIRKGRPSPNSPDREHLRSLPSTHEWQAVAAHAKELHKSQGYGYVSRQDALNRTQAASASNAK